MWSRHCGLGFQAGARQAFVMVILGSIALGIALLRLVFWLRTRERDKDESEDESEKDYWRIHSR